MHYQSYWSKRQKEEPFRTLGFKEESEQANNDTTRWEKQGQSIVEHVKQIETYLENDIFKLSEEEQDTEIKKLMKQYDESVVNLERTENQATKYLSELNEKTNNVLVEALRLETKVEFKP